MLKKVLWLASGVALPIVSTHHLFLCEYGPKMSERVIQIDRASIHPSVSMKFSFHIFNHFKQKLVEPKLVFKL